MKERIQKILASHGIASRRACEKLIEEGKVRINGKTAIIGESADSGVDRIEVNGKRLPIRPAAKYIMLNKPRGYVTTVADERGRKTVMELVESFNVRLYPVGRLDMFSEGLLIMTNDGELANTLMHPSNHIPRVYHVGVSGDIDDGIKILSEEIEIDGSGVIAQSVYKLHDTDAGAVLCITIGEGKNRQIRRMCEAAQLEVRRLKRVALGKIELGTLPAGKWRELTKKEIEYLTAKQSV